MSPIEPLAVRYTLASGTTLTWRTVAASVTGGSSGKRRYGWSSLASRVVLRGVKRMGDIIGGGCTFAHRFASAADRGVSACGNGARSLGACAMRRQVSMQLMVAMDMQT